MVKIEFKNKIKEDKKIYPRDWENGYYLVKDKESGKIEVVSKGNTELHFMDDSNFPSYNDLDYNTFYDYYKILGRIDFKITDIKFIKNK